MASFKGWGLILSLLEEEGWLGSRHENIRLLFSLPSCLLCHFFHFAFLYAIFIITTITFILLDS